MAITSELVTQDFVNSIVRLVKAALVGLEKLSDSDAANYLNTNMHATQRCAWMPPTFTAAMIHESRAAKI